MGMDYGYAGSASYPRFNDEVKGIVELFGGKMVTNRKPENECTMVEYFMEEPLRYEMPEGTPEVFTKWSNDPYGNFTFEETRELYAILKTRWRQVKKISHQIAEELELRVKHKEPWNIW